MFGQIMDPPLSFFERVTSGKSRNVVLDQHNVSLHGYNELIVLTASSRPSSINCKTETPARFQRNYLDLVNIITSGIGCMS